MAIATNPTPEMLQDLAGSTAAAQTSLWWSSADGGRLHAVDWAGETDRPAIIGLPGLHRNGRDFTPLAAWLAGRYRVLGVDLRGRGRSDNDPDPYRYTMPTYIDDIARLLDAIGAARAVLVGGSNGGVLAALFAAAHPDRVAGLVFNDVAHRFNPAAFARVREYIHQEPHWPDWQSATSAMAEHYALVHPRYSDLDWQAFARRVLREEPSGTVVPDFDAKILVPIETPGGIAVVGLVPIYRASAHIPSLLLHGERSDFLSDETAAELAAELPLLELVKVPEVGHLPDLSEPQSIAGIERLLARVR